MRLQAMNKGDDLGCRLESIIEQRDVPGAAVTNR